MAPVGVVEALATEWRARRWLSALAVRVGTEGLAVAASVSRPRRGGDQHAAAVRDILAQGATLPGPLRAGAARRIRPRAARPVRRVDGAGPGARPSAAGRRPGLAGAAPAAVCALPGRPDGPPPGRPSSGGHPPGLTRRARVLPGPGSPRGIPRSSPDRGFPGSGPRSALPTVAPPAQHRRKGLAVPSTEVAPPLRSTDPDTDRPPHRPSHGRRPARRARRRCPVRLPRRLARRRRPVRHRLHAVARGYGLDAASVDDAVAADLARRRHRPRRAARARGAARAGCAASCTGSACARSTGRAGRCRSWSTQLGEAVSVAQVALRGRAPQPPEDQAIRNAQIAALRAAVARLPHREQELMALLSDAREHSYTEIARALGLPIGSIGPTRARCIAKLRRCSPAERAERPRRTCESTGVPAPSGKLHRPARTGH